MKRFSYDFVKAYFESVGYTLLSKEYINSYSPLKFICDKGHNHSIRFCSFKAGQRCGLCNGNILIEAYSIIKKQMEKEGYVLLTKEYINNRQKMEYICPKGHKHSISWKEWFTCGNRCPYCSGKIKKTIEEVYKSFLAEGYILNETEYINSFALMKYTCSNGHQHKIRGANWFMGHRCPYCAGQLKPTIEEISKSFKDEGYTLLSNIYKTNKTLLEYRCPKGHRHSISWLKWKQGRRCRECSYITRGIDHSGENSPNWKGGISCEPYCYEWSFKEFKNIIKERDGHQCLNPYCGGKEGHAGKLVIHHIDYNKKNCSPSNLITLCRSCNIKANKDREWHEAWYKAIMYRRYKHNY